MYTANKGMKNMNEVRNEELNELNIFSLRELARDTGVASPTSKLKSQLIEEIVEIREGKRDPYIAKTKQGRPPKSSKFQKVKMFTSSSISNMTLRQDKPKYENIDSSIITGYLQVFEDDTAVLVVECDFDRFYVLDDRLLTKYSLKTGDKILAELENGTLGVYVKDILTINGVSAEEYIGDRVSYLDLEHVPSSEMISNNDAGISFKKGDNVYVYGRGDVSNSNTVINAVNGIENVDKIYVNVSVTEKNKSVIRLLKDAEMFTSNLVDSVDVANRVVLLAIEHAKRLFETGRNVIIIIDDVLSVSAILGLGENLSKQLLSLSKNARTGQSVSILAMMSKDNSVLWAEKLADKKYAIINDKFELI